LKRLFKKLQWAPGQGAYLTTCKAAWYIISVLSSVCLSVSEVNLRKPRVHSLFSLNACIVTKQKKDLLIFIPYERSFSLSENKNGWWGGHLLPEILGQPTTLERNRRFWTDIRSYRLSRSTYQKSSINTNRKSTTRFTMSLRLSSYVALKPPKEGGLKTAVFGVKSHFVWRKSCYKVSLCENCKRQSCKAFIGLTVQKWLVGAFYLKFLVKLIALQRNRRFSIYFRS